MKNFLEKIEKHSNDLKHVEIEPYSNKDTHFNHCEVGYESKSVMKKHVFKLENYEYWSNVENFKHQAYCGWTQCDPEIFCNRMTLKIGTCNRCGGDYCYCMDGFISVVNKTNHIMTEKKIKQLHFKINIQKILV